VLKFLFEGTIGTKNYVIGFFDNSSLERIGLEDYLACPNFPNENDEVIGTISD